MIYLSQRLNEIIDILEPILEKADFISDMSYRISLEHVNLNSDCKTIYNYIYKILFFKKL